VKIFCHRLISHTVDGFPAAAGWLKNSETLFVACSEGKVMLVDCLDDGAVIEWQAHEATLLAAACHPFEPILATSGQDAMVKLWHITNRQTPTLINILPAVDTWVEHLAWRPDGQYLAVASGRDIQIFSAAGEHVNRLRFEASTIADLAWSPRGTELAVAGYGGIDLITGASHSHRSRHLPWKGSLLKSVWRPDGKVLAATCQDNAVHFWRLKENRDASISGYDIKPLALAWSTDSRYLITGGSPDITTWTFDKLGPEGTSPVALIGHSRAVTHLCLEPRTGLLASGCKAGEVRIWSGPTARQALQVMQMETAVAQLCWQSGQSSQKLAMINSQGCLEIGEIQVS
jgi:WD40 repeat protein